MKGLGIVSLLACFSVSASADYYLDVDISRGSGDLTYESRYGKSEYDALISQFAGEVYLSPITDDNGPLAEAGFLSKTSSLYFNQTQRKLTRNYDYGSYDLRWEDSRYGFRWVNDDFFLAFDYEDGIFRDDYVVYDRELYRVQVGAYASDNTALWLNIASGDVERFFYPENETVDESEKSVHVKQVAEFSGGQFLAWELMFGEHEEFNDVGYTDRRFFGADVAFFPSVKFAFGLLIRKDSYDDIRYNSDGDGVLLAPYMSYFVSDAVELYLEYQKNDITEARSYGDVDIIETYLNTGLSIRF